MRRVVYMAGSLRVRPLRKSFKRCNMQFAFPREQQLIFDNSGVEFPAIVDGRRIPCRISREALDDHFDAEREGTLHAFLRHRGEIEAKARELIERLRSRPDGSILISNDLWIL